MAAEEDESTDRTHNRIPGTCKYPEVETIIWKCAACEKHLPAANKDHTMIPGECRAREMQTRDYGGRVHEEKAPKERTPKVRANTDATTRQQPRAPRPDEPDAPPDPAAPAGEGENVDTAEDPDQGATEVPSGSSARIGPSIGTEGTAGRRLPEAGTRPPKPPAEPRPAVPAEDANTGVTTEPQEWTAFDIGHALKLLHSTDTEVVRRTLRRLHVRYWHAPEKRMRELLQHAGAPVDALNMVKQIVDTCRVCRMWTRPGPRSMTTTRLATGFLEIVQWDILFVDEIMV